MELTFNHVTTDTLLLVVQGLATGWTLTGFRLLAYPPVLPAPAFSNLRGWLAYISEWPGIGAAK